MTMFDDLEATLSAAAATPSQLAGRGAAGPGTTDPGRVAENGFVIEALLDAPKPSRLARVLRRLGMPDLTVPLVTATPALRRSWLGAIALASLFGLSAARSSEAAGPERLQVFLAIAPLIPLLGVAFSFGAAADPAHETVVAAPVSGFRVFVIRAITVLAASVAILSLVSVLLPGGGPERVAWLLPALGVTAAASALATRMSPARAATIVAVGWLGFVIVVTNAASAAAAFGPVAQVGGLVAAVVGGIVFAMGRRRFDVLTEQAP